MARRLRQVVDLYTTGRVVRLRDGSTLWVQPLNPFEQDTARNEAQIAKARLSLAIREFGSDEQTKVRGYFFDEGLIEATNRLVDAQVALATPRIIESFRNDPDWTERLSIVDRGNQDTATPLEGAELELLTKISSDFATELTERLSTEREFLRTKYEDADEDTLWQEYLDWYIDRRCSEVMLAEFRLHQAFFGVRWCDGVEADGVWSHENCAGHVEPVFAELSEARSAPEELMDLIIDAFDTLELTVREAKNSDRQGSSSDSSPLPSEAGASTASTPEETRVAPPGSSSSPSPTPSQFLASVN